VFSRDRRAVFEVTAPEQCFQLNFGKFFIIVFFRVLLLFNARGTQISLKVLSTVSTAISAMQAMQLFHQQELENRKKK